MKMTGKLWKLPMELSRTGKREIFRESLKNNEEKENFILLSLLNTLVTCIFQLGMTLLPCVNKIPVPDYPVTQTYSGHTKVI